METVEPSALRSRPALLAVQALVSLTTLGAVVWWASKQDAPSFPASRGALGAIVLALAVYALATLARAERWHRILAQNALPVGRGDAYRLTTVCYMGNNTLPARGGDLLRVVLLGGRGSRRAVLGTVVAERLLDAAALALVFGVVAFGVLRGVDVPDAGAAPAAVGVVTAIAVAVAVALARTRSLERVREFLRPVWAATSNLTGAHGLTLLALSLVVWALEAGVYLVTASAVGLELGLAEALYVVALTNLFALLPAAPGYAGTFDAAVVFAVGSLGHDGATALAYLLMLRFVLFVPITLVGAFFFFVRYRGAARALAARG